MLEESNLCIFSITFKNNCLISLWFSNWLAIAIPYLGYMLFHIWQVSLVTHSGKLGCKTFVRDCLLHHHMRKRGKE